VLKGVFGALEDGIWCVLILGGLRWPSRGFYALSLQKKAYRKNYRRKTGKLQEAYKRKLREISAIFDGVRVGGKGGRRLE